MSDGGSTAEPDKRTVGCPSRADLVDALDIGKLNETFGAHLAECASCRGHVEQLGELTPLGDRLRALAADGRFEDFGVSLAIDGFTIVREIHRGGQGVVYEARQHAPPRTVALKVPLNAGWTTPAERRRFEREIEVIAELRHPRIVTLYGVGVTSSGTDFFSMEFVDGPSLDEVLAGHGEPMPLDPALAMFIAVAEAVEYAHQVGVIHRDIKPSNVIVDAHDEPHLLDFGLAKRFDEASALTQSGHFVGSLAWAAPEQVSPADGEVVSTATDVYALGLMLYRMVTGCHAYEVGVTPGAVVDAITNTIPNRPSRFIDVSGDVDAVIARALEKRPKDRYPSVSSMLTDCRALRDGKDVMAASYSGVQRFRRTVRRHPTAFGLAALAIILGLTSSLYAAWNLASTEHRERLGSIDAARRGVATRKIADALDSLWSLHEAPMETPFLNAADAAWERERLDWSLREVFTQFPLDAATEPLVGGRIASAGLAVHPDGQHVLCLLRDKNELCVYSAGDLDELARFEVPDDVTSVGVAPSGGYLAFHLAEGGVKIVEWSTLQDLGSIALEGDLLRGGPSTRTAWSPVDDVLFTAASGDPAIIEKWVSPAFEAERIGVTTSGAARRLLVTERFVFLSCVDKQGHHVRRVERSTGNVTILDDQIALAGARRLVLFEQRPNATLMQEDEHPAKASIMIRCGARALRGFAIDLMESRVSAEAFIGGGVTIFSAADGTPQFDIAFHPASGLSASFTRDGSSLITCDGRRVRRWAASPFEPIDALRSGEEKINSGHSVAYSPEGDLLVIGGSGEDDVLSFLGVIDVETRDVIALTEFGEGPGPVVAGCVFHPDDSGRVLGGTYRGELVEWDYREESEPRVLCHLDDAIAGLALSPDRTRVALAMEGGRVVLWGLEEAQVLRELEPAADLRRVSSVDWLADGTLVTGVKGGSFRSRGSRLDWYHGESAWSTSTNAMAIRKIAAAPDGAWVASATDSGHVLIVDSSDFSVTTVGRHTAGVLAVAVSPDGRLIASADPGVVNVYHVERRAELASIAVGAGDVFAMAFHPSGRELTVVGHHGARLWDLDAVDRRIELHVKDLVGDIHVARPGSRR